MFHDLHSKYASLLANTPWEGRSQVVTFKEKLILCRFAATSKSVGTSGGAARP